MYVTAFFIFLSFCNFTSKIEGSFMQPTDPFSFKEINSIEDFNLQEPKYITTSDGMKLAYYDFVISSDHIVVLYAGSGLYGNKTYQWVAKTLKEKYNIACYIVDLRGHGYSQGVRGDASSIHRVWQDVEETIRFIKTKNPKSKIYLTGHSSGAGLIINYSANMQNKLEDAYIFLAPYLGPKSNTIKTNYFSNTSFVKKIRPWVYILGSIFSNSSFIHWKAVFFNYPDYILKSDPLILSFYTYAMSAATTPYEVEVLLKKIDKPTAIFIGKNDEQFSPEKVIDYKKIITSKVNAEIIDNTGHISILLQAPKLIYDYITYLQK